MLTTQLDWDGSQSKAQAAEPQLPMVQSGSLLGKQIGSRLAS